MTKQEKEMKTLEDIKAFLASIEEISSKVLLQTYVNTKDMEHSIYVINRRVKYIQKMLDKVGDK